MKPLFLTLIWTLAATMAGPALAQSGNNASGVYVSQIGSGNKATVSQDESAVSGYAKIEQTGTGNESDGNVAAFTQKGGKHWAQVTQSGIKNTTGLAQEGSFESRAIISQTGQNNLIGLTQISTLASQFASITQTGEGNKVNLSQDGAPNSATLSQNGDRNVLNLAQNGGSTISWTQTGNDLSSVGVSVDGAQTMIITQTKP